MTTLESKICLLGASAVGKTSLVSRYVHGIFSDVYRTTLGVRIDRKRVELPEGALELLVWDLEGADEFSELRTAYLRGARGYLLVADGTRGATLDAALDLHQQAEGVVGKVPFLLVLNKLDLQPEWEILRGRVAVLESRGWRIERTSARTGQGVEACFRRLAREIWEEIRPHESPLAPE